MSLNKVINFDFASLYPQACKKILNMNPIYRKSKIKKIFNERFKQEN